jgi:hypothetical protein
MATRFEWDAKKDREKPSTPSLVPRGSDRSILSAATRTASSARVPRRDESDVSTKKKADEPRPEYDFRGGERGRYAKRAARGYAITVHRKPAGSPPKASRQNQQRSAPDRVDPPDR